MTERWNKGKGRTIQWIRDHVAYPHEDRCLVWPFSKTRGYGTFGYMGKPYYAHRFMCELAKGDAPSDIHEAAHSCGNEGCVNPRHLSWKTPTNNMLDCRGHGTHVRSRYGNIGKITSEQAETIRGLKSVKKLWEIADEYGISESAVSNIWVGRTHSRPRKLPPRWTAEEDARLQAAINDGHTYKVIAGIIGRPETAVSTRALRLGLKSKWRVGGTLND